MKRRGTYYLLYAANNAGPDSPCTPTLYHACQAYAPRRRRWALDLSRGGTAPVSSTTIPCGCGGISGPLVSDLSTADAKGGGHFRRSVAIDPMTWDDSVSPPAIRPVTPSRAPAPPSADPQCRTRGWAQRLQRARAGAILDRRLERRRGARQSAAARHVGQLDRAEIRPALDRISLAASGHADAVRIRFFADHPAGSDEGVAPPAPGISNIAMGAGGVHRIAATYPTGVEGFQEVRFRRSRPVVCAR